jgi:hypothetical protein
LVGIDVTVTYVRAICAITAPANKLGADGVQGIAYLATDRSGVADVLQKTKGNQALKILCMLCVGKSLPMESEGFMFHQLG